MSGGLDGSARLPDGLCVALLVSCWPDTGHWAPSGDTTGDHRATLFSREVDVFAADRRAVAWTEQAFYFAHNL